MPLFGCLMRFASVYLSKKYAHNNILLHDDCSQSKPNTHKIGKNRRKKQPTKAVNVYWEGGMSIMGPYHREIITQAQYLFDILPMCENLRISNK